MIKKKPIITYQGKTGYYRENSYVQNPLLKALTQGITDPKELRKISGLGKVADVYRTLDKMALRKEYHKALISFPSDKITPAHFTGKEFELVWEGTLP